MINRLLFVCFLLVQVFLGLAIWNLGLAQKTQPVIIYVRSFSCPHDAEISMMKKEMEVMFGPENEVLKEK